MPLSHDLQTIVADVNAAIAAGQPFARTELEVLRRNLNAAARDAGKLERAGVKTGAALTQLLDGIDGKVADLAGLARHARTFAPTVQ